MEAGTQNIRALGSFTCASDEWAIGRLFLHASTHTYLMPQQQQHCTIIMIPALCIML
jgi:hypothetical protein